MEPDAVDNSLTKPKGLIDRLIFVAVIATPVMTLPQVYDIWFKHAKGTSLVTWTSYVIIAFVWFAYGLKQKDKPIIIMQALCIVTYSSVVVGLMR